MKTIASSMTSPTIVAKKDLQRAPRIVRRRALQYRAGADPREDRPAHVRAASSIVRMGAELVIVQDDALFFARLAAETADIADVALPRGAGELRLFDDLRGNKKEKLDLEAATVVSLEGKDLLLAFGSGSSEKREKVVLGRPQGAALAVEVVHAEELYRAFREARSFSGSELNIEGAVAARDRVTFFQRGNGAPSEGVSPVDATASVDLRELVAYLERRAGAPRLTDVQPYDLGSIEGCRLTFTDAAWCNGELCYVAAAEASPDATRDGPVAGVALGVLTGGAASYALLLDERGEPCRDKVEGIVEAGGGLLAVVDRDDAALAADLVYIEW